MVQRVLWQVVVLVFVASAVAQAQVTIGRGGEAATRSDTDLIVYDPNYSDTLVDRAPSLFFNASVSDLVLGSGNSTTSGDDGDIFLQNGGGVTTVSLSGGSSTIVVRDGDGAQTFSVLGLSGAMTLGGGTESGDLSLRDAVGSTTISLTGSNGDVTNALGGNGLVKAWCRVNPDGSFNRGYRCNSSATETQLVSDPGRYEVDFTALSTDIRSRVYVVSCARPASLGIACTQSNAVERSGDTSSIFVETRNSAGTLVNSGFTIVIY